MSFISLRNWLVGCTSHWKTDKEVINIDNYLAADTWDVHMPLSGADAGNYFEINIAVIKLL